MEKWCEHVVTASVFIKFEKYLSRRSLLQGGGLVRHDPSSLSPDDAVANRPVCGDSQSCLQPSPTIRISSSTSIFLCVCLRAPVIQLLSQSENEQKNLNNRGDHRVAEVLHVAVSAIFD